MQAQERNEDEPTTTSGARGIERQLRLESIDSWRRDVLRGMLTVAAVISPIVVAIALSSPSTRHSWAKVVMFIVAGLAFPALRLLPWPSVVARASAAIVLAFGTGVLSLATFGFSSGSGVVLLGTSVIAVIFLGRTQGVVFIALSLAAFFVVGTLVTRGALPVLGMATDLDPHRMRNWTRVGVSFALLAILVTSAIDLVIRHVEASSRATARALDRLRLAHEHLGQLHRRLDATEEEERRSLSRELHDELGQTLAALRLRLQLGEHAFRLTSGAGARAAAVDSLALVDALISRVRRIAVDLRPPLLDEVGLVSALRVYLDDQAALSGLAIKLHADEPPADGDHRLPPDFEITCFRVVQESVTNAIRHAAAHRIEVRIGYQGDRVLLSIKDDGCGFAPAILDAAAARGHLGIVGMRERVRARGGRFELTSRPAAGTTIAVELTAPPIGRPNEQA
jgi:signal transduction histidine kinase